MLKNDQKEISKLERVEDELYFFLKFFLRVLCSAFSHKSDKKKTTTTTTTKKNTKKNGLHSRLLNRSTWLDTEFRIWEEEFYR